MKTVNSSHLPDFTTDFVSPKGKYAGHFTNLTIALGFNPHQPDASPQAPFDVAIHRIPPGKANFPFHSHSAQYEFYHITAGSGKLRHDDGEIEIKEGDAFMCEPGQAHQLINDGETDLVYLIVADNPKGESCHYPDSQKWLVRSPQKQLIRSESIDYFDGEE
ncbi:MAG: cupin domain-containing protein [Verrucomicrobiota bacterium]